MGDSQPEEFKNPKSSNEAGLTVEVAPRDWIQMTAIGLSVVLVVAILVTAIVLLSLVVLFKTGSLRDLTYLAEVVRAFRRKKRKRGRLRRPSKV